MDAASVEELQFMEWKLCRVRRRTRWDAQSENGLLGQVLWEIWDRRGHPKYADLEAAVGLKPKRLAHFLRGTPTKAPAMKRGKSDWRRVSWRLLNLLLMGSPSEDSWPDSPAADIARRIRAFFFGHHEGDFSPFFEAPREPWAESPRNGSEVLAEVLALKYNKMAMPNGEARICIASGGPRFLPERTHEASPFSSMDLAIDAMKVGVEVLLAYPFVPAVKTEAITSAEEFQLKARDAGVADRLELHALSPQTVLDGMFAGQFLSGMFRYVLLLWRGGGIEERTMFVVRDTNEFLAIGDLRKEEIDLFEAWHDAFRGSTPHQGQETPLSRVNEP